MISKTFINIIKYLITVIDAYHMELFNIYRMTLARLDVI